MPRTFTNISVKVILHFYVIHLESILVKLIQCKFLFFIRKLIVLKLFIKQQDRTLV